MAAKKERMGRPTMYTPDAVGKILKALAGGNTRKNSAAYAGVTYTTFRQWEIDFPEFSEQVEKAEADCEARNVAIIQKAAQGQDVEKKTVKVKTYKQVVKGEDGEKQPVEVTEREETTVKYIEVDWRASAWWLERRRSDEYKLRQQTDVTSGGEQVAVIGFSINPPTAKQKEG